MRLSKKLFAIMLAAILVSLPATTGTRGKRTQNEFGLATWPIPVFSCGETNLEYQQQARGFLLYL